MKGSVNVEPKYVVIWISLIDEDVTYMDEYNSDAVRNTMKEQKRDHTSFVSIRCKEEFDKICQTMPVVFWLSP